MLFETYSQKQARLVKAGQPDVYQYEDFSETFRNQIVFIWNRAFGNYGFDRPIGALENKPRTANKHWNFVARTLAEALGIPSLVAGTTGGNTQTQCIQFLYLANSTGVLDILDLTLRYLETHAVRPTKQTLGNNFSSAVAQINTRFQQHGIGFEFVDGQLVRKDSQYLHEEAVKPALGLLNGPGFSGPQDEFLRAHEHLRAGEYQDAILDANNAFESTMKAICEVRGWTYEKGATAKALIGIMFDNDLIPRPLTSHFDHLRLVLEAGLPTVRNKMGGHGQGSVPVAVPEYLAGYALHLAATNIVLLVEAHKAKS